MDDLQKNDSEDLSAFKVFSRREIVALLRNIATHRQLVNMSGNTDGGSIATSILDVEEVSGKVIIDCAQREQINEQLLESDNIAFETVLDQIRILFFVKGVERCEYRDAPALMADLPDSVIRLQRREFYRVPTPITMPVSCTITIPAPGNTQLQSISLVLQNVSGGGIALIDEQGLLDHTVGRIYYNCRIDLPGAALVVASLQLRNVQQILLPSGRHIVRLGCLFVDLPNVMLTAVQRYISKLEREQNARVAGR